MKSNCRIAFWAAGKKRPPKNPSRRNHSHCGRIGVSIVRPVMRPVVLPISAPQISRPSAARRAKPGSAKRS